MLNRIYNKFVVFLPYAGVQSKDSIVLWQHNHFRGTHRTVLSDDPNLHLHQFGDTISSIEVMGTFLC